MSGLTAAAVGIPEGMVFGVLLQKSRMSAPEHIKAQMALKDWTMMKTFLSAAGSSAISLGLLNLLGVATLHPLNINLKGNLIGGFILGTGMTLGGACPGTVLAQIGEGVSSAPYTLLGGLLGATAYGALIHHESFKNMVSSTEVAGSHNTLSAYFNQPMWSIAIPMGIMLISFACGLEKIFPSAKVVDSENNIMKKRQWSPILSGIVLGSLQIPVNLLIKTALGTSSAFVTLASTCTRHLPLDQSYFSKFYLSAGAKYVWQLISDFGIVAGSYVAATMGKTRAPPRKLTTKEKVAAAASGFLLLFGARIANGCTSGHGLSGMAQLSVGSMITVASMLAGGIGLGVLLDKMSK